MPKSTLIIGLIIGLLAGCYAPNIHEGIPCSDGLKCPSGQRCDSRNVCVDDSTDGAIGGEVPITGSWSIVQTRGSQNNDTGMSASGAGHLIVVAIETGEQPATAVTDTAGSTYVSVPGSRANDALEKLGIELWYTKSSIAGATRVMASGPTIHAVVMWEVAGISTSAPLGPVATLDDQPTSTMPYGAAVTTPAPGMFVVSIAIVAHTVTGLVPGTGFRNDQFTFGNGWAHLDNASAPAGMYRAQWNQPNSGESCATSAAFFPGN